MYNIDGAGVPKEGTIGVVVSGGFDSTVLWHYLYGICKERNQKIIPFTVPKNDGALTYAIRMLEWSAKRYGDKTLHPVVINSKGVNWSKKDYQGEEVARQLIDGIKEIMDLGLAGYVYTGIQAQYKLGNLNITPSFTPGLYHEGDGKDLGHLLEFKSEVQISLDIFKNSELGFSYNHISNASLGDKNPGANSYMFNFLKSF